MEKARDDDNKIIAFSIMIATCVAVVIALTAPLFPRIYNTNDEVKQLAKEFLLVHALFTPQFALLHTCYFTIRSGGNTVITFLFDSFFMWVVSVPLVYFLSRYTSIYVIYIYVVMQISDWIKCLIGLILVKKGMWMNNIVR